MGSELIKYELALVICAVVGFAVWQLVSLKRDGEALRRRREAEARQAGTADPVSDGTPPAAPPH